MHLCLSSSLKLFIRIAVSGDFRAALSMKDLHIAHVETITYSLKEFDQR